MVVSVGVSRAASLCASFAGSLVGSLAVSFWLLAASAHAQSPPPPPHPPSPPPASPQPKPVTGFVSSYEIMRTVRSAGFEPLAPPLREGTVYVLRATDFRGILMRVVLDARTGMIRDVTRIVPAVPSAYGMMPPAYPPPPYASPYGPPPYGAPAEYEAPAPRPEPGDEAAPMPPTRPAAAAVGAHPTLSAHPLSPPLPRPRPALASQKAEKGAKPASGATPERSTRSSANPHTVGVDAGTAPVPSAAPGKTPAPAPLND